MKTRVIASLSAAAAALDNGLHGLAERTRDAGRIARVARLRECPDARTVGLVVSLQHPDGGWTDNEDTIWCASLLSRVPGHDRQLRSALDWLGNQRSERGGWGRNPREPARIPLTAIALRFLGSSVGTERDRAYLERMWASDLGSEVRLSYKGGFFLLAQKSESCSDLILQTAQYLSHEANDDGGFGPWRGHPIGSDPWSTGICLVGLCRFPAYPGRQVVERAVEWLLRTQLPSGHWPYHFLDEGTAYAYWGLSEAAKLLEGE